jgi:A/G-specific adenine glycosylase
METFLEVLSGYGVETDITSAKAKKRSSQVGSYLNWKNNPALFNQAIMEFGALHCVPKKSEL